MSRIRARLERLEARRAEYLDAAIMAELRRLSLSGAKLNALVAEEASIPNEDLLRIGQAPVQPETMAAGESR